MLKPSMVLPGNKSAAKATPEHVASATLEVLRATCRRPCRRSISCPAARPREATANLNAMNAMSPHAPWVLSFSYARALQDPAMRTWAGRDANVAAAQKAFYRRLKMNSLARDGKWSPEQERAA